MPVISGVSFSYRNQFARFRFYHFSIFDHGKFPVHALTTPFFCSCVFHRIWWICETWAGDVEDLLSYRSVRRVFSIMHISVSINIGWWETGGKWCSDTAAFPCHSRLFDIFDMLVVRIIHTPQYCIGWHLWHRGREREAGVFEDLCLPLTVSRALWTE